MGGVISLLELPGDLDTPNAQGGDVIEDDGRDVDGAAGTPGALVHYLGGGGAAIAADGDPSATLGRVVGVGVIAVLRRRQGDHGIVRSVETATGSKSLFPQR